ncbi:MAG: aspartate-semialdehyde dehydrogenase [Bacillota bacterium]
MLGKVAIVGVTGLVGGKVLEVLMDKRLGVRELVAMASHRSVGQSVCFQGSQVPVIEARPEAFRGVDLAFFCAGTGISRSLAPEAVKAGAVVVDKSNAFRMDPAVPLVVPEVNPEAMMNHRGIIASPNCSTIQMVVALKPLHDAATLTRVVVTTFQSVSGTGKDAVDELVIQSRQVLDGMTPSPLVYPHQIAFNLLPHIDSFDPQGYSGEEMKMVKETQKILGLPGLPIAATCVRVPVAVSHSESVLVETARPLGPAEARRVLSGSKSIVVLDDPASGIYPMPVEAAGKDEVFVGRIRQDLFQDNALHFWVVSDNLRKGAATNAVQIAEALLTKGLF